MHQVTEVDIIASEQIDLESAEMDEMWSFVHDKSQQYWLWWAVDHRTGKPLAYCFGTREHQHLKRPELCVNQQSGANRAKI